ncbi:beta-ketoacyl-ACP synthase II [Pediococcus argentinicus]|uniref:3-oxoacyl-[acyl-carrier-protein] synthase 2 n=1 Tax=Pediococcus argentinicus TaxID=480391 RepID=A0A0R2NKX5_9LACO|nr:beta-ketoacyl-ACP synthase II [Pediococcus argentinicus]KRO25490.1 beta-ketoacyl-acyl-carrier-protein synthase II [Pediococcus argentinicus]NKZ22184.1 beta-ketoacyl-ACP synthase II [Pediococcus argentinicus]GEP19233.1 3-oxoacyl-[acyl-carrier-protein] synthase 2 [Pediococcus argentinicus]
MEKRVVVTGMGAVTPLGNDLNTFLDGIYGSKLGIAPITHFDASTTGITVAGEVKDFDPIQRIDKKLAKRMDRFSQFGLYATTEAMEDAGLGQGDYDPEQLGVIYGSGIGGLTTIQEQVIKMHTKGPKRVSPLFVTNSIGNMVAGNISIAFNAQNTSQVIVTACASGTNAIGNAFEHIKNGKAEIMITGGSEASINEIGIAGFASLTALSTSEDPTHASMPFDKNRGGFVMGEGGGTLILESLEHAQQRGAKIYGEIVGYGSTSDAYHMTQPDPEGAGAIRAMQQALDEGNVTASDVQYVNAHGTGTVANDSGEAKAIKKVFEKDSQVKVSSTKGMTGHLLGAAGAIEAIATIGSFKRDCLPVNVGVFDQDPECEVELVNEQNADCKVNYALSNSFGFGGHNAVLAFKRWD